MKYKLKNIEGATFEQYTKDTKWSLDGKNEENMFKNGMTAEVMGKDKDGNLYLRTVNVGDYRMTLGKQQVVIPKEVFELLFEVKE